jgi:hypothetical protein
LLTSRETCTIGLGTSATLTRPAHVRAMSSIVAGGAATFPTALHAAMSAHRTTLGLASLPVKACHATVFTQSCRHTAASRAGNSCTIPGALVIAEASPATVLTLATYAIQGARILTINAAILTVRAIMAWFARSAESGKEIALLGAAICAARVRTVTVGKSSYATVTVAVVFVAATTQAVL